jgi:hypothetical protein
MASFSRGYLLVFCHIMLKNRLMYGSRSKESIFVRENGGVSCNFYVRYAKTGNVHAKMVQKCNKQ